MFTYIRTSIVDFSFFDYIKVKKRGYLLYLNFITFFNLICFNFNCFCKLKLSFFVTDFLGSKTLLKVIS